MLLTRNQFLIILALIIVSCGAWAMLLKMFLDSSLALKWAAMIWFFGGCFIAVLVVGSWIHFHEKNLRERAQKLEAQAKDFCRTIDSFVDAANNIGKSFAGFGRRVNDVKFEGEILDSIKIEPAKNWYLDGKIISKTGGNNAKK